MAISLFVFCRPCKFFFAICVKNLIVPYLQKGNCLVSIQTWSFLNIHHSFLRNLKDGLSVAAMYFDILKAFDTVCHEILLTNCIIAVLE